MGFRLVNKSTHAVVLRPGEPSAEMLASADWLVVRVEDETSRALDARFRSRPVEATDFAWLASNACPPEFETVTAEVA